MSLIYDLRIAEKVLIYSGRILRTVTTILSFFYDFYSIVGFKKFPVKNRFKNLLQNLITC